ncbi:MAG: purine-binding chemotaxis protein CheW [Acidobacteria bacterium]|nr:purine-binding chemotaxis protein CheW [Acidobacteriota bacterium]
MSEKALPLVVFTLDEQRYALPLFSVERILPAIEATRLPKAPDIVLGVINVRGQVIPVFNIRKRFCLAEREMRVTDHLILGRTRKQIVAFTADAVIGLAEHSEEKFIDANALVPGLEYLEGILKLPDGMVLIHDLKKFLSLEEEMQLDVAMSGDVGSVGHFS